MNKSINFRKVFGLITLLMCGVWTVNAQDLSVNNQSSGYYCMDANEPDKQFTVSYVGGDDFTIESAQWTYLGGGINILSGANTTSVRVSSQQNGTTYGTGFSKFAKGKLKVDCVLKKTKATDIYCNDEYVTAGSITTIKEVSFEVEIRKTFSYPDVITNEIVGPECVKLGDQVTYSIEPWVSQKDANNIGFDEYYWNMDQKEDYYSSDKSSITFTVDQNFLTHKTLTVSMGACNVGQTPVSRTLGQEPDDPIITINNQQVVWKDGYCLPLGAGQTTITITNASNDPSITYTWEKLSGWTHSETNNTLTFKPDNDTREIRLIMTSACGEKTYDLMIKRSFAEGSKITNNSTTPNCLTTGQEYVFQVPGAGAGIPMTWEVEAGTGWSIEDDNKIAKPTIKVGDSPCLITVTDECGNPISDTFYPDPSIPVIQGETCVKLNPDGNTVVTYYVEEDENATGYIWTLSNSQWAIASGQSTHSIEVIPGQGSTTITVYAVGNCDNKIYSTPVTVNLAPEPPATITTNDCINYNTTDQVTFSVEAKDGETYSWDIDPNFGTIVGNSTETNGTITVKTKGVNGSIRVWVDAKGDCEASDETEVMFIVTNNGFSLSGYQYMGGDLYMVQNNNMVNPVTYKHWLLDDGVVVPNGTQMMFGMVGLNLPLGDITNSNKYTLVVDAIYDNGCKVRMTKGAPISETVDASIQNAVIETRSKMAAPEMMFQTPKTDFAIIYPNPAKDIVNIDLSGDITYPVDVHVVDIKGSLVIKTTANDNRIQLDSSSWIKGSYLVMVSAGKNTHRQVVIKN